MNFNKYPKHRCFVLNGPLHIRVSGPYEKERWITYRYKDYIVHKVKPRYNKHGKYLAGLTRRAAIYKSLYELQGELVNGTSFKISRRSPIRYKDVVIDEYTEEGGDDYGDNG